MCYVRYLLYQVERRIILIGGFIMAEQQNTIFRKQSIDSVSSPEQLNDYIRSATPSVWFVMTAVIVLLIGVCVWGVFGHLDTRISTGAVASGGTLTVFVPEQYEEMMTEGLTVTVNDREYVISSVSGALAQVTGDYDVYALHKAGLNVGDFGITATAQTDLPDGSYAAVVTVESVSPMSFILN